MAFNTLKDDDYCPCGSGFKVRECCIPENAPISERYQGFSTIQINSQIIDLFGRETYPLMPVKVTMDVRKPLQLNANILNVLDKYKAHLVNMPNVFCKSFFLKVASNFSIVLQLQFPQCCKLYFPVINREIQELQTYVTCTN